jgi:hypothetical protein
MSEAANDLVTKIVTPIATAIAGAVAAWIKSRHKTLQLGKEKQQLKEENFQLIEELKRLKENQEQAVLVAQGLAVGYYANFIRAMSGILEHGEIQVRLEAKDRAQPGTELEAFGIRHVDLFCIIPHQLVLARERECFNRLESHRKAAIVRGKNIRDFDINYSLSTRDEKRVLQIYDVTKPLFALRSYLKEFRKIDENHPDWQKVTEPAVTAFKETLDRMRLADENAKIIKFDFEVVK